MSFTGCFPSRCNRMLVRGTRAVAKLQHLQHLLCGRWDDCSRKATRRFPLAISYFPLPSLLSWPNRFSPARSRVCYSVRFPISNGSSLLCSGRDLFISLQDVLEGLGITSFGLHHPEGGPPPAEPPSCFEAGINAGCINPCSPRASTASTLSIIQTPPKAEARWPKLRRSRERCLERPADKRAQGPRRGRGLTAAVAVQSLR